jgi:hypothetical protein
VVAVAPQVFDLLEYLIRNRDRVVSKNDLIAAIWEGRIVSDAALTTRLNVARGAIGDSGEEQQKGRTHGYYRPARRDKSKSPCQRDRSRRAWHRRGVSWRWP